MKEMFERCVIPEIEAEILKSLKVNFDDYKDKLNLACGADYKEGWVNLDSDNRIKADVYQDLDAFALFLNFKSDSFDLIYASHILEHIRYLQRLKAELYRILRPGGNLVTIVPHYLSDDAWGNPTHVRAFSIDSFRISQFWPGEYEKNMQLGYLKGTAKIDGAETNDTHESTWIICKRTKVK